MEGYIITTREDITIIEMQNKGFKMRVLKDGGNHFKGVTALLEATLYIEKNSFVPVCSYFFELLDADNNPSSQCTDVDFFKAAVGFYFNTLLDTELYVISVPKASILCPAERREYGLIRA
jgi:hypothetical protein